MNECVQIHVCVNITTEAKDSREALSTPPFISVLHCIVIAQPQVVFKL